MPDLDPQLQPFDKPLPPKIERRLESWRRLYVKHLWTHYIFGILGGVTSALAGFRLPHPWQQFSAAVATASVSILAFVRPERKYQKFVMAWRTLDIEADRFQCGFGTLDELLDAKSKGEQQITVFESMEDHVSIFHGQKGRVEGKGVQGLPDSGHAHEAGGG